MQGINYPDHVHFWDNTQGKIVVSLEKYKRCFVFEDIDKAANWLFLEGYEKTARQLNGMKDIHNKERLS